MKKQRLTLHPVTLRGQFVQLVPLAHEHGHLLASAVRDGDLWKLWYTYVPAPEDIPAEIDRRLGLYETRSMIPFTVIDVPSGEPVGMTTYMNVDAENGRVEIGSTWYAARVQRTALNTEAKLLLLTHAFEDLDCIAVEFRTHWLNHPSRKAIERLGAKLDGVLRSHAFAKNGTLRDTCVYSIVATEWPGVKANLLHRLGR